MGLDLYAMGRPQKIFFCEDSLTPAALTDLANFGVLQDLPMLETASINVNCHQLEDELADVIDLVDLRLKNLPP